MNIIHESYTELFNEQPNKELILDYSGKFRGYNANIKMNFSTIIVNASKQWKQVSPDIQKGLCQELLVRLFKTKRQLKTQTINMDLYHNFIRSLSQVAPKTQNQPILEQSFKRVNENFFNGLMPQPNLKLGEGINRLGTYEYPTDTITISKILLENEQLMDYVMYHEILHKKHKYTAKAGRSRHHSTAFRQDERSYPNSEELEKELNKLVRKNKSWLYRIMS